MRLIFIFKIKRELSMEIKLLHVTNNRIQNKNKPKKKRGSAHENGLLPCEVILGADWLNNLFFH